MLKDIIVPDIGEFQQVEIIELSVSPGETVEADDSLLTLETDKAAMDIPSPFAGTIHSLTVKIGDRVSKGDCIGSIDVSEAQAQVSEPSQVQQAANSDVIVEPTKPLPTNTSPNANANTTTTSAEPSPSHILLSQTESSAQDVTDVEVKVPDIGGDAAVTVIDVLVQPGQQIEADSPLITLESDKASMDIPSPISGDIINMFVKIGDKVQENSLIALVRPNTQAAPAVAQTHSTTAEPIAEPTQPSGEAPAVAIPTVAAATPAPVPVASPIPEPAPSATASANTHQDAASLLAGPSVRRMARVFNIDLNTISGTGPKGRILREDIEAVLQKKLTTTQTNTTSSGSGLPVMPEIDFSQYGAVEITPLSRIKRLSGTYLHRNWVLIPHVTHFDEVDITDLEAFRKKEREENPKRRLTILVFIMKALIRSLKAFPEFNASLEPNGQNLVLKKHYHLGIAVDTPDGLVVPVIRDVDRKGAFDLADELAVVSEKARNGQLKAPDMQGSSCTISSLGGIGGIGFTPIINAPDVAILGVSRSLIKPVYQNNSFVPRLMLPLSLSYDHRVIDGAQAARFTRYLAEQLSDIRRLLL